MRFINRKAKFDYEILEKYEFGIVLLSSEVKAVREGKVSFIDSYLVYKEPHMWIYNLHIGNYKNLEHENKRDRIILLKRKECNRLLAKIKKKGCALIPLELFFNQRGYIKLQCGLGLGKKEYDKKAAIKAREMREEQGFSFIK